MQTIVILRVSRQTHIFGSDIPGKHLMTKGVPEAVAAKWSVESAGTEEIMRSFYGHLVEAGSPSKALQLALDRFAIAGIDIPTAFLGRIYLVRMDLNFFVEETLACVQLRAVICFDQSLLYR